MQGRCRNARTGYARELSVCLGSPGHLSALRQTCRLPYPRSSVSQDSHFGSGIRSGCRGRNLGCASARRIWVDADVLSVGQDLFIESIGYHFSNCVPYFPPFKNLFDIQAEALRVLAARRYVHRDVKPMNIMQQTSSTYVLIDAGLALDLDGEALSLVGNAPVGTPAYFSPEQITLASRDLDPRSDLFSLGVTMYECATGEHPFLNDALPRVNVFRNIVELAPPDPREFISTLPDRLCAVISKLLQKDRDTRYQHAEQLLADLM